MGYFDFAGAHDGSWLLFVLVAAASKLFGKNPILEYLTVPVITGYMLVGFICGPFVLKVMTVEEVANCVYVQKIALSFIAFSAGAEMHLPEIIPLFKQIVSVSLWMTLYTLIIGIIFIYVMGFTPLLSWISEYEFSCQISIGLLAATILSARSPTSLLAVVRELEAKGPATSLMVAITVGGDVIVLTIFALGIGITSTMCAGESFDASVFFLDIAIIIASFAWGGLLGLVLIVFINVRHLKHLILPVGFLMYLTCDYILETTHHTKYALHFDVLLVCMAAGFVVTNTSDRRVKLNTYLHELSPLVFIPFFTFVGLSINAPVLLRSIAFASIACVVRAICMVLGTLSGGKLVGLDTKTSAMLWMGLLAQAGVSLGLVGIVGELFHESFGPDFQSTMIGVILINQIVGPLAAKYVIKQFQEDKKGQRPDISPWFEVDNPKVFVDMVTQTEDHHHSDSDISTSTHHRIQREYSSGEITYTPPAENKIVRKSSGEIPYRPTRPAPVSSSDISYSRPDSPSRVVGLTSKDICYTSPPHIVRQSSGDISYDDIPSKRSVEVEMTSHNTHMGTETVVSHAVGGIAIEEEGDAPDEESPRSSAAAGAEPVFSFTELVPVRAARIPTIDKVTDFIDHTSHALDHYLEAFEDRIGISRHPSSNTAYSHLDVVMAPVAHDEAGERSLYAQYHDANREQGEDYDDYDDVEYHAHGAHNSESTMASSPPASTLSGALEE
jgi:Kef-type K+ transport system membrane component KefB